LTDPIPPATAKVAVPALDPKAQSAPKAAEQRAAALKVVVPVAPTNSAADVGTKVALYVTATPVAADAVMQVAAADAGELIDTKVTALQPAIAVGAAPESFVAKPTVPAGATADPPTPVTVAVMSILPAVTGSGATVTVAVVAWGVEVNIKVAPLALSEPPASEKFAPKETSPPGRVTDVGHIAVPATTGTFWQTTCPAEVIGNPPREKSTVPSPTDVPDPLATVASRRTGSSYGPLELRSAPTLLSTRTALTVAVAPIRKYSGLALLDDPAVAGSAASVPSL
jgi:hypothetical protein